ncbi:MAG TPA: membrane dipeptidase [Gemmataceae bacterium]|jgi:membrane dipeptidase|nr:membrane dipeptidase [Gemmataceae bacterium]
MLIFDSHLDLAWNAIDWNRDLRLPCDVIRQMERDAGISGEKARACNTVSFPDLRRGKITTFIATLLPRHLRGGGMPAVNRYTSMTAAYAAAYGQLAYYRGLEQEGLLRPIRDLAALNDHVRGWQADENSKTLPLGFILSMEGADSILRPDQVEEWYAAGLRIVGPAHYGVSPYAHGTGTEGGLFEPGPALLREMQRVGMILDVTHLSDQCFDEALEIYTGPVLASHHNNRTLVPNQRQLTDEQTKRLIELGAVIGHAFDNWMLHPGWIRGESDPKLVKIADVVNHIDRVCQLAGNARHAAIGTDLDGGFGLEQSPSDIDTIADLQKIPDILKSRGYSQVDIEGIMHGNWLRFFHEAWKK